MRTVDGGERENDTRWGEKKVDGFEWLVLQTRKGHVAWGPRGKETSLREIAPKRKMS